MLIQLHRMYEPQSSEDQFSQERLKVKTAQNDERL